MSKQRDLFDEPLPTKPDSSPSTLSARTAELRARHPGMLLLLRVGLGSYRWLEEDYAAVQQLGVPLSFDSGQAEQILRKVLRAGHLVAVCEEN